MALIRFTRTWLAAFGVNDLAGLSGLAFSLT